jgi:hypothetical protein
VDPNGRTHLVTDAIDLIQIDTAEVFVDCALCTLSVPDKYLQSSELGDPESTVVTEIPEGMNSDTHNQA